MLMSGEFGRTKVLSEAKRNTAIELVVGMIPAKSE